MLTFFRIDMVIVTHDIKNKSNLQVYHCHSKRISRRLPDICYLWRGDFNVNDDGGQRGLEELGWVVDGVGVQHHQLQGAGQLKDPLNLTLHLS